MTAERLADALVIARVADALQWSRGSVTAERLVGFAMVPAIPLLQWSRGSVTAER